MAIDCEMTVGFIILAKCFVESVPYDAKGGGVLLHSIPAGLEHGAAGLVDRAAHLHVLAGLGDNGKAREDARESMSHLVSAMEWKIAQELAA